MKHLLTWFILGACLLLFGCQQSNELMQKDTSQNEPADLFCKKLDLFYNDDFSFSYHDDLKLFQAKIASYRRREELNKTLLSPATLCQAMEVLPDAYSMEKPGSILAPMTDNKILLTAR